MGIKSAVRVALAATTCSAVLAAAAVAHAAAPTGEYAPFVACPYATPGITSCIKSTSSSGALNFGRTTVPLTAATPIVFQGGFAEQADEEMPSPWFDAAGGYSTLSPTRLVVPGGLTGLLDAKTPLAAASGPARALNAIYARPELAGALEFNFLHLLLVNDAPGVTMPLKVHLENPALGPDCYIGSDANPVTLRLTDGRTHPPAGIAPLTGGLANTHTNASGSVLVTDATLVDSSFVVPVASNCGASPRSRALITSALNLINGLPSPAGENRTIMTGLAEVADANEVRKSAH